MKAVVFAVVEEVKKDVDAVADKIQESAVVVVVVVKVLVSWGSQ